MRPLPVLAFAAVVAFAAGCGSSSPDVNPVTVLKKLESCSLDPGSSEGQKDAFGTMYASCAYDNGATVTARAVDVEQAKQQDAHSPDDAHKVVSGKGFYLVVTADPSLFADGSVDVPSIANAVGGKIS